MNHELVMLRGIGYCRKAARDLSQQCLRLALRSFDAESCRGSTLSQLVEVAQIAMERDKFLQYLACVKQALRCTERGNRALLFAVYVKGVPKEQLCKQFGVSPSTVYRKLAKARQNFSDCLCAIGCTEQWFTQTFGATDWAQQLLLRSNGSRISY